MAITFGLDDILMVRLNFDLITRPDFAMNVLHYRIAALTGAPPTISQGLGAIAQAMYDKFSPAWANIASEEVAFRSVTAQSTSPAPKSVAVTYSPGVPRVGDVGGESMPLQDAPTLLKKTDLGSRKGLGRLFFVGLAETLSASGFVSIGGVGGLTTFAELLDDNVPATLGGWSVTLAPVLVSGPDTAPTLVTPIRQGILSNAILKTQRRRRPGKGS